MEKKCTKCGEVKSLDEFNNDKNTKDSKSFYCKLCTKEYRKIHGKKYYQKHKEKLNAKSRLYYKNNKEKLNQRAEEYRKKNKDKILLHYKNNKEKKLKYLKKYLKERRKIDPIFKLRGCISSNICKALKAQGYTKNTKTFNILKCEYDFFIEFLNGVASNGYTYGVGNLHLDHVIPISLAETEDEAILLSHYSNYQLLSADENIVKGNRYINPTNLKRVLNHHPEPNKIKEIYSRL